MFAKNNLIDIYNKYREKKLAHAYLVETNNLTQLTEDLKLLIKVINCPEEYHESCQNCNLCNLIDKNNLPSLITINPDGAMIKKNQIEELKKAFETKPIYSKYNIYIINNAEKLNSSSANAMLKFIEEPTDGIIGFFLTNNKDIIIPTIKSRCQCIVVNYESEDLCQKYNLTEEELKNNIIIINDYLNKIANQELINNKELILTKYPERKNLEILFKLIFEVYYNAFLKKLNKKYNEKLLSSININESIQQIIPKLNIITKFLQDLSYNVNMELLLDKFVIEMRD